MSNAAGSGNDYTDPHTQTFATEGAAPAVVKKPNPIIKWVIILLGTFMLIAAGLMAWGFMNKKSAPAIPPQAQAAPPVQPPADPSAPADPVVDPSAPMVDPSAPPVDPNAAIVDPSALGAAPTLDANGQPIVTPDQLGAPLAPGAVMDPTAPADLSAPVSPEVVVPQPPAPAPTPVAPPVAPPVAVVQDPAGGSISQVMDTARQEMMSALDRIERRISDVENRFSSLENRVSAMEGRSASPQSTVPRKPSTRKAAPRKTAARKPVRKPVNRMDTVSQPVYAGQNRIEILDGSMAPVSRTVIIERDGYSEEGDNRIHVIRAPEAAPVQRAPSTCRVQSIKPGRVWVRRGDGSFATYGVGDALPGGGRADSIDPDAGVMSNGRLWNCD